MTVVFCIRKILFDPPSAQHQQTLYNQIDGKGTFVWGPVRQALDSLSTSNGVLTERVWINLNEIEHVFMEGGDFLIASGTLTAETLNLVRARFDCLDESN